MSDQSSLRDLLSDDDERSQAQIRAQERIQAQNRSRNDGRIFGLSAGQRAFLSVLIFLNVLIIGMALMVITGRIAL